MKFVCLRQGGGGRGVNVYGQPYVCAFVGILASLGVNEC